MGGGRRLEGRAASDVQTQHCLAVVITVNPNDYLLEIVSTVYSLCGHYSYI